MLVLVSRLIFVGQKSFRVSISLGFPFILIIAVLLLQNYIITEPSGMPSEWPTFGNAELIDFRRVDSPATTRYEVRHGLMFDVTAKNYDITINNFRIPFLYGGDLTIVCGVWKRVRFGTRRIIGRLGLGEEVRTRTVQVLVWRIQCHWRSEDQRMGTITGKNGWKEESLCNATLSCFFSNAYLTDIQI